MIGHWVMYREHVYVGNANPSHVYTHMLSLKCAYKVMNVNFMGKNHTSLFLLAGWCLSGENENMRMFIRSFTMMQILDKHY